MNGHGLGSTPDGRTWWRTALGACLAGALCLGVASPARGMIGPDAPAAPAAPGDGSATRGSARTHGGLAVDRSLPRGRWAWPLAPRPAVVARFRAPSTVYGQGHRGVDLAATVGAPVHAVAGGRVSFAGVIGGKPTVAVTHGDGIRSTYEPVTATVVKGEQVVVGEQLGTVAATGSHCMLICVHLGAIRGSTYLDPLRLLGWWRVRLLPLQPPG